MTSAPAPAYLCGPEAEAAGAIVVEEHDGGAEVPELVLTSGAALPLLLLEGETVLGVKQNRTLNVSVLCLPQTPTVIPVSGVEAGRWGAVQPVSRSPRLSPSSLRAAKTRSVVNSVRTRASKRSDQNLVWETVDSYASFLACASPTAMEDVASAAAPEVAALVEGLEPVDGQRRVLVVTAGGVVALDLFDKPSTLAAYWDGLLAGYAIDAVDRRGGAAAAAEFGPADAQAFLDHVLGSPATETGAVGLGRRSTSATTTSPAGRSCGTVRSSTSPPSAGRRASAGKGPDPPGRPRDRGDLRRDRSRRRHVCPSRPFS
jgi:hypothetical protein